MPLPRFIQRRVAMRRCVNTVMMRAYELQQLKKPTAESLAAHTKQVVATMVEASQLLIEQQQDNERQHYEMVNVAVARKRKSSALDDYAAELLKPGSAAKRQAAAPADAKGKKKAGRRTRKAPA